MELSLESIHKSLCEDPTQVFVQNIEGKLLTFQEFYATCRAIWQVHVYSGSFNPLHDGHKAIYEHLPKAEVARLFELSINRFDKPPVTAEELKTRLKQFVGYANVMVTNVAKFVEKAGVMRHSPMIYFHIGADTLIRIMQHSSIPEIEGYKCQFVVYNRMVNGSLIPLPAKLPMNCKPGKEIPADKMGLSSSAIRAKALAP